MRGRFAPSPTGRLHLGNLRTALLAWLFARSAGSEFLVRMEDLDTVTSRRQVGRQQLDDLAALGLDWDGVVVWQSERLDRYRQAISDLGERGLVYECFCTRREIQEASQAPNAPLGPDGAYPGTCRTLTAAKRADHAAAGRRPALRLRGPDRSLSLVDAVAGRYEALVDDVVLARADAMPAYNLAVVVDDAAQRVEQVVRGDDLLSSTPRQIHLARVLGLPVPSYAHVPLALGPDGSRLAKRHGSVTLGDLRAAGVAPEDVVGMLAVSLALAEPGEPVSVDELVGRFDPDRLPRTPWEPLGSAPTSNPDARI